MLSRNDAWQKMTQKMTQQLAVIDCNVQMLQGLQRCGSVLDDAERRRTTQSGSFRLRYR